MGHKAGKIALGIGLLMGAITGLLFAPDEGKNIRKKIAKGDTRGLLKDLENVGQEMKDMVLDFIDSPSVQETLEKAKDKAADVASIKREELDALLANANQKADDFKKKVAAFVKEQRKALDKHAPVKKSTAKKSTKKKPNAKKSTTKKSTKTKKK